MNKNGALVLGIMAFILLGSAALFGVSDYLKARARAGLALHMLVLSIQDDIVNTERVPVGVEGHRLVEIDHGLSNRFPVLHARAIRVGSHGLMEVYDEPVHAVFVTNHNRVDLELEIRRYRLKEVAHIRQ